MRARFQRIGLLLRPSLRLVLIRLLRLAGRKWSGRRVRRQALLIRHAVLWAALLPVPAGALLPELVVSGGGGTGIRRMGFLHDAGQRLRMRAPSRAVPPAQCLQPSRIGMPALRRSCRRTGSVFWRLLITHGFLPQRGADSHTPATEHARIALVVHERYDLPQARDVLVSWPGVLSQQAGCFLR